MKKSLLFVVLAAFGLFSTYVVYIHGYFGLWQAGLANAATLQILLDLVIACLILIVWMFRDAPERGINPWPYALLTLAGGSLGVLVYLIRREYAPVRPGEAAIA
ncbi:MAG TPA: DUF2834 domain-containing protein [Nevskiales bacterium]|nr:DUF2834 domain-containing protein [Nevskiales bacterium]